ncbi:hypothetical protein [Butyrivibrio sp. FCS014]|uniref:hypothetical protein n=1 Tax=Butyrivibrio sp. FCS014 TaxID=1408304 RepID=UPI00046506D6|nr:hypothetical protein [Butyrivibrio sp. FCS014]
MYSSSSSTCYYHKNSPKIIDTIRIHDKYFDVSVVKEKVILIASASAIVSSLLAAFAVIMF